VSTPQKKLITWSAKEVGRWTAALPVPGLAEAASGVLLDINGAELSTLTEEDLSAAGLKSKVSPPPLPARVLTHLAVEAAKSAGRLPMHLSGFARF
jgi:hypothetical protein